MNSHTFPITVNPSSADALDVAYARVSLPLPRGVFAKSPVVRIENAPGAVPCQSDVLAHWPDGSVRIVHLTFPAREGEYQATASESGETAAPDSPVVLRRDGETISVSNGRLRAEFADGVVRSIRLSESEWIGPAGIEMRATDEAGDVFIASAARDVQSTVEFEGALRTVVALRGKCTLGENTFLDFRLRFEFLAGVEGFSVGATFFNLVPGRDFLPVRSIELKLQLANAQSPQHSVAQSAHGIFMKSGRVVTTAQPFHIVVDDEKFFPRVLNAEALEDETEYPFYLDPPLNRTPGWGALVDNGRSLLVEMDDFQMLRPKTLDLEDDAATFGIWPARAGLLSLQQGRSREVWVRVALGDAETAQHAARVAQLRDVWRAQLPHESYAAAGFFDAARLKPFEPLAHPRFERWLGTLSGNLNTVATFFDLGDTPDSGYRRTYAPLGRSRRIRGDDGGQRYFTATPHGPLSSLNDLEDFEPIWVNNEYDVVFCIGSEFVRTGDLSLFQKLRWFSRHTIDVDFLDYSDHRWLHRAQPAHSARHTTTGAYPSHFWTQGLAQYYFLTADPDALEVIIALADKTIENFDDPELSAMCHGLNREAGWGILSLLCAYEASGDARFDLYARALLEKEIAVGLPEDIATFSFGHTSILLGARQYLQIHAGEDVEKVKKWFLDFVDLAISCSRQAPSHGHADSHSALYSYDTENAARGAAFTRNARNGIFNPYSMALDPLAFAYETTGDRKYIEAGLRSLEAFADEGTSFGANGEGKPFAMVYRTWINYFQSAAEMGFLQEWEWKH